MLNVVYSEFLRNNQQNLKLSFILLSTNSKTERSRNMSKNKRRLFVIKMAAYDDFDGINDVNREIIEAECQRISKVVNGGRVMIIAQKSPWTIAMAQITQSIFNTYMFLVVDVSSAMAVAQTKARNLKDLIKVLNLHAKAFDTLIIITHADDISAAPIFSSLFLGLTKESPECTKICLNEIIEYGVET